MTPPQLQNLVSLLTEVETALAEINDAPFDQHSKASKARALAALKAAQYETAAWGAWLAEHGEA